MAVRTRFNKRRRLRRPRPFRRRRPRRVFTSKIRRWTPPRHRRKPARVTVIKRRPRRRRPRYWPAPWRYYPYPLWRPLPSSSSGRFPARSGWQSHPQLRAYTREAQQALWRHGFFNKGWLDKLSRADRQLVNFVNRYHRVSGFERVVRHFFGAPLRRQVAQLGIQLINRLSQTSRDWEQSLRFDSAQIVMPDGELVGALKLVRRDVHYLLHPWRTLNRWMIRRLWRRSVLLFHRPRQVRWVFSRSRLGLDRRAVVREVSRLLRRVKDRGGGSPHHRWLQALDRLVVVL